MYTKLSYNELKDSLDSYFGFIITKDKRYIFAQTAVLRGKRYFFQNYIDGETLPEQILLKSKYCFELSEYVDSFLFYRSTPENNRYYPFSFNSYVANKDQLGLVTLHFIDSDESKVCYAVNNKFYYDDKVIGINEVIKSGKIDLTKSYHSSRLVDSNHNSHNNYTGLIYQCLNIPCILIDYRGSDYNGFNFITETFEKCVSPIAISSNGIQRYNLELPTYEKIDLSISEVKDKGTNILLSVAKRGDGTIQIKDCCDFIKTSHDKFTYYLNLYFVYKYGNDEKMIHDWIKFISTFAKSKFTIGEETDNVKLGVGRKEPVFKYLGVDVNGAVKHNYENYINLMLIRYLQNGNTAYIPKLTMDIYNELHETTGINEWQAFLIAHHTDPYYDYSFGCFPNINLTFQDLISATSELKINKFFSGKSLGTPIQLFEERRYLEIYNKIKKHYDNL